MRQSLWPSLATQFIHLNTEVTELHQCNSSSSTAARTTTGVSSKETFNLLCTEQGKYGRGRMFLHVLCTCGVRRVGAGKFSLEQKRKGRRHAPTVWPCPCKQLEVLHRKTASRRGELRWMASPLTTPGPVGPVVGPLGRRGASCRTLGSRESLVWATRFNAAGPRQSRTRHCQTPKGKQRLAAWGSWVQDCKENQEKLNG